MNKLYGLVVALCAGAGVVAPTVPLWAQQGPARQETQRQETLAADGFAQQRLDPLDREIAARVMRRVQAPANEAAGLDLSIDLRIVHRWMWAQVAKAPSADLQAAAYARALAMEEAVAAVEQQLRLREGAPVTPSQAQAMKALHQLTFGLEDLKDAAALDHIADQSARAILNIASPNPVDPATIAMMRPRGPAAPVERADPRRRDPDQPATLPELSQEARVATVSAPLRAQLVAVANAALEAEKDPQQREESERLRRLLVDAMGMVRGLASNTAVAPEARMELENELAAALALMADRRLVAAGEARMKALQPYRQTLTRLGRLHLTPEQRRQYAAAFHYAQNNPDDADAVFGAMDELVRVLPRHDALPAETPADPTVRRTIQDLRQQFARARADLPEMMANLGQGGLISMNGEELGRAVREMRRTVEVLELLYPLPGQVQALVAYKPRPLGGLERRVQAVVAGAAIANATPVRQAHETTLRQIAELGALAEAVNRQPLASLPRDAAMPYSGGVAEAFDNRCKMIIMELANAAAAGQELDTGRLSELRQARELVGQVEQAAKLTRGGGDWENLPRWADWTLTASDFDAMLTPLQREITGAVQAVADGATYDADALRRMQARYEPIVKFVARGVARSGQLSELPTGLLGAAGKLMTGMSDEQYAGERYVGLAAALWVFADPDTAEPIVAAVATRVAPQVGMRYREAPPRRGRER